MPLPPETRESLILRLPNSADVEAWDRFVEIYEPLLFRLARSKGFQLADAEDFVQEALLAVSRAIDRWLMNDQHGKFRVWLFHIAQNLAANFLTRPKYKRLGSGDSQIAQLLNELPSRVGDSVESVQREYRRELFRWAAEKVRERASEKQWRAFWLTSVDNVSIQVAADELEMSVGSIYIARSRMTAKIRTLIQSHEEQSQ
ncbi:MAG: sigma-70 family RNA polymerase sigma factor [Pirellula sp.]